MATVRINNLEVRRVTVFFGRRLANRVMNEVQEGARAIVSRGPYVTGRLASSIEKQGPFVSGSTVTGRVGTTLDYALAVHNGAEVHDIFPTAARQFYRFGDRSRPQLKFFWRRIGKVVYLPHIPGAPSRIGRSHPGQKGKFFLTRPLAEAAIRHNMRVVP